MEAPRKTIRRAKELRTRMSPPEVILWQALRREQLSGLRFRRQYPMGPYILDFYCDSIRLCLEVDGYGHSIAETARHDMRRDAWLSNRRITVLRIDAAMIRKELPTVLDMILAAVAPSVARSARHLPQGGG